MTDAEVKQAIERHGLSVFRGHKSKRWTVSRIQEHPMIDAKATATTLTEAVAEVVRQIEETQE